MIDDFRLFFLLFEIRSQKGTLPLFFLGVLDIGNHLIHSQRRQNAVAEEDLIAVFGADRL